MTYIDWSRRHQKLREQGDRMRSQIAELVSQDWSISAAARSLGISQQAASVHWRKIREGLGDQAR